MAAYQTQQINVGSIAAPDVGSVFANFADRLQKQQSNQIDMARQMRQDDRQQVLNQRADQEWNRQQNILKAKQDIAKDFAANQFADKYTGGNAEVDAIVNAYTKAVEADPSVMTDENNARIQALVEKNRGWKENAIIGLTNEFAKRGIYGTDASTEIAGLTNGLLSKADQQKLADERWKANQDLENEKAKQAMDILKLKVDINKANQTNDFNANKATADNQIELRGKLLGGSSSGGGSGNVVGINRATAEDVWKAVDELDVSPGLIAGLPGTDTKSAKVAAKEALDKGVNAGLIIKALKNSTDDVGVGKGFSAKAFNDKLKELQEQYNGLLDVNGQDIGTVTSSKLAAITPEEYLATVPDKVSREIMGNSPISGSAVEAKREMPWLFPEAKEDKVATATNNKSLYVAPNLKEVSDTDLKDPYLNIKKSEGLTLTPKKDSDGGYTIGYGYNMKQNASTLDSDFKAAGLSPQQMYTAKFHPEQLEITNDQAQKLFNNVVPRYVDSAKNVLNKNGVNYDNLNSEVKATVNQMIYRGDLGNGAEYSKGLISAIKQNDLSAISNYIGANESKLPPEVVTRIRNDLAINEERARRGVTNNNNSSGGNVNTTTTTTPATTNSNKDSNTVNDIISKFEKLNEVSPTLQSTDSLFNMSNTLGFGGSRYGQHDISNFRNEVNRNKHAIENLLTPDNLVLVRTQAAELENSVNDTNNKLSNIITTRNGLLTELKTTGKTDISSLQDINKKYSELITLRNAQQAQADKINEVYNRMVDTAQNDRAGNAAEEATVLVNEAMRKAYDPTASEALWELAQTGFTYVGVPKTKAMYSFLNAPAKVAKGTTKTGSKLPVVQGSARTVSEGTFKREPYIPKNSDVLAEIGEVFKSPNLKSDPIAKEKLTSLAAKYPEFADEIWRQFQKL